MPGRFLVLSASVGAGHLRAAQAVELALRELAPEAHVENVDVLSLTNSTFRRIYSEAYLELVNKAPHVLGYMYDRLDKQRAPRSRRDRLRLLVEKVNLGKFCELIDCGHWSAVVNTHFLPAEIIASLRRARKIRIPHVTATTDFETHRLWVNEPCDHYCTATQEGAAYFRHLRIPPDRISVTGIPIHPAFSRTPKREAVLRDHGLRGDRPILLQLAGGFGVGPIEQLFRAVLDIEVPLEVIVVTGRNAKVAAKLRRISPPRHHHVTILGFTEEMDELMAVADIVLSKPGGLTTSEVLARGAAMAIVNPIPGQESRNSDFLLENGAAIKISHVATMPYKLSELLSQPQRLELLKQNAMRLAKPQAAYDVARIAMKLAN